MKTLNLTPTVSSNGIIRVLPDMFSSRDTFLKELAQNSSRAKATEIIIDYDKELHQLKIKDNGVGFSSTSWEKFFITAESGWDEDTMKNELPFGIGAASCVFSSKEVIISSRGYIARFDESFYAESKAVQITPTEIFLEGTEIILNLKDGITINSSVIEKVYQFFPLKVVFNGKDISRPRAIDNGWKTIEHDTFSISYPSLVYLNTLLKGLNKEIKYVVELQGFIIETGFNDQNRKASPVVRLKPNHYRPRVPDREVLVDSFREAHAEVISAITQHIESELILLNQEVSPEDFSRNYWDLASKFSPELLADKPLPSKLVYQFNSLPFKHSSDECLFASIGLDKNLLTEKDIEKDIHKINMDAYDFEAQEFASEPEDALSAYCTGVSITDSWFVLEGEIPEGHWILNHLSDFSKVFDPKETEVIKSAVNEFASYYVGEPAGINISICKKADITLVCKGETYSYSINNMPASVDCVLYVPNGTMLGICDAIRQVTYRSTNDDHFWEIDTEWLDMAEDKIANSVSSRMAKDSSDVVRRIVEMQKDLLNESGKFEGKQRFIVDFNELEITSVRLI
jgi:hypothetical protein